MQANEPWRDDLRTNVGALQCVPFLDFTHLHVELQSLVREMHFAGRGSRPCFNELSSLAAI